MTYVVANLHGRYEKWQKLEQTLELGERDVVYVLGDLVDYGDGSMELLCDLSMRYNVLPIVGDHDWHAARMLSGFEKMRKGQGQPDAAYIAEMTAWVQDGGQSTLEDFRTLDDEMREGVLEYLSDLALYEEAQVGGVTYRMLHAGLPEGVSPEADLDELEPEELLSAQPDFTADYIGSGVVWLFGHTPTGEIPGGVDGKIFRGKGCMGLHCGDGILGCLCLETGDEYYF